MSRSNEGNQGAAGQNVREMGEQVRQQAQQKYEELREQAGEYYEQGRQKAQEVQQSVEEYVREQPIKSLMIAAACGLVLGVLWKKS